MSIHNSSLVAAVVGGLFSLIAVAVTVYFQNNNDSEVTKSELRTCWESVNNVGNVLSFCFRGKNNVSRRVIFPNQTNESPSTICQSIGTFKEEQSKYILIFDKGSCDNGRGLSGYILECVTSTINLLKCIREKNGEKIFTIYSRI